MPPAQIKKPKNQNNKLINKLRIRFTYKYKRQNKNDDQNKD